MGCTSSSAAAPAANQTQTLPKTTDTSPDIVKSSKKLPTITEEGGVGHTSSRSSDHNTARNTDAGTATPIEDENKLQLKDIHHPNEFIKTIDNEAFQPSPGLVVKLRSLNPKYPYDKIFFNIFHDKAFNPFTNEFIISKEEFIINDNKGKECIVLNILLSDHHYEEMEATKEEKDKTLNKLIDYVNAQTPFMEIDKATQKFPHISKGFVGENIPLFIIPVMYRRKSLGLDSKSLSEQNMHLHHVDPSQQHISAMAKTSESNKAPTVDSTATQYPSSPKAPLMITQSSDAALNPVAAGELPAVIEPSLLNAPPKMVGWLRKKGHLVMNWKTRYFVLDNGFLTYYVDKSDLPPYGKTMKGQICLAGYREAHICLDENGKIDENKLKHYEDTRSSFEGGNEPQLVSQMKADQLRAGRKSSGFFTSEPVLRIHLIFVKGIVSQQAIDDLHKSMQQHKDDNKNKLHNESESHSTGYEFMMEASNLEEKYAWLAALDAHTNYIEAVANSGMNLGNFEFGVMGGPPSMMNDHPTNSSVLEVGDGVVKSSSGATEQQQQGQSPRSTSMVGGGGSGKTRSSIINSPTSSQKWKVFLTPNEEIVFNGLTGKPNPLGMQLIRELLLVKSSMATPSGVESKKRLIYIDANTFEMKGEIIWDPSTASTSGGASPKANKLPVVKKVNDTCFDIMEGNRSYRFYPKDEKTVDQWIDIITTTPPV